MKYRRGITLVDMLFAISLLIVFMLLASRLLVANFKTARTTFESESSAARFDQAVTMLRDDVEQSDALEMPQKTSLHIHLQPDQTVDWVNSDGTLQRTVAKQTQTWKVSQHVDLKLESGIVTLSPTPTDQITMAPLPKSDGSSK